MVLKCATLCDFLPSYIIQALRRVRHGPKGSRLLKATAGMAAGFWARDRLSLAVGPAVLVLVLVPVLPGLHLPLRPLQSGSVLALPDTPPSPKH